MIDEIKRLIDSYTTKVEELNIVLTKPHNGSTQAIKTRERLNTQVIEYREFINDLWKVIKSHNQISEQQLTSPDRFVDNKLIQSILSKIEIEFDEDRDILIGNNHQVTIDGCYSEEALRTIKRDYMKCGWSDVHFVIIPEADDVKEKTIITLVM